MNEGLTRLHVVPSAYNAVLFGTALKAVKAMHETLLVADILDTEKGGQPSGLLVYILPPLPTRLDVGELHVEDVVQPDAMTVVKLAPVLASVEHDLDVLRRA